jgi:hypothetical protein
MTEEFVTAMTYLASGYQNFKVDREVWAVTVKRYFDDLGGYSPMVFQAAVRRCSKAHPTWFPNVGQLRELCEAEIRPLREAQRWAPPERQIPENTHRTSQLESVEEIRKRFWTDWAAKHGQDKGK